MPIYYQTLSPNLATGGFLLSEELGCFKDRFKTVAANFWGLLIIIALVFNIYSLF